MAALVAAVKKSAALLINEASCFEQGHLGGHRLTAVDVSAHKRHCAGLTVNITGDGPAHSPSTAFLGWHSGNQVAVMFTLGRNARGVVVAIGAKHAAKESNHHDAILSFTVSVFKQAGVDVTRFSDQASFLRGFLERPREVGSVIPSSRFLERRITRVIDAPASDLVVELGPGTGGTTRAVLNGLGADARLLAIDTNPAFITRLQTLADPRLIVQQGSADDLAGILRGHDLPAPDVVFSGIPFSTMPREAGLAIIQGIWEALAPGGRFMAYQFRDEVRRLAVSVLGQPTIEREWLNIPPMAFYAWDKPV